MVPRSCALVKDSDTCLEASKLEVYAALEEMESSAKRMKTDKGSETSLDKPTKDADGHTNGSSHDIAAVGAEEKRTKLPLLGSGANALHISGEVGSAENQGFRPMPGDVWVAVEADAAEDKGLRHTMEDAWVVLPDASLGRPGKLRCAHFAIYDGHGGRQAAEFARAHLHANIVSAGLPRELLNVKAAKKAILDGFKCTDEALLRESVAGGWQDGATAVCVWILGNMVFVANIGDAKVVLGRIANTAVKGEEKTQCSPPKPKEALAQGLPLRGVTITREHKAIFPLERARIEKAGGYIGENGRLLGRLEVSRAFGDRQFKKVGVSAVPDVNSFEITERERFMILGCDGLWGVFGPSDAVEFVDAQLKEGVSVGVACRRLIREAVRERKCKDNCTAVLIVFKHV